MALPEEEAATSAISSSSRLKEFRRGRHCTRQVLQQLQINLPVLRNPDTREPLWPKGIVGSITHSGGWAATAVASTSVATAIGIDLEQIDRSINPGIIRLVCTEDEKIWLSNLDSLQADLGLKTIFSAKESIYKCLFPHCRIPLTFQDATVSVFPDWKGFRFRMNRLCPPLVTSLKAWSDGVLSLNSNTILSGIVINSLKSAR